ncbi:MAG TPA: trigger factor, partial [Candidatus Babeliales bacterium]|nr:trigger factor [Candidatus Babeliales bacterium]
RKGVGVQVPSLAPKKGDLMTSLGSQLTCSIHPTPPHFTMITITVPANYVSRAYDTAAHALTKKIDARGFSRGEVPLEYIKTNYQNHLTEHIKKFLFHYLVISYLFKCLEDHQISVLGEPRLMNAHVEMNKPAVFEFECTTIAEPLSLKTWKHLPFKAPGRKHYRDIDRQVESFIQEEQTLIKELKNIGTITIGDIVCFTVKVVDEKSQPLFQNEQETLWLKIGNEEGDTLFQHIFLDKHEGETFYTQNKALLEYFSDKLEQYALLEIHIELVLHNLHFDFDALKEHFNIKSIKDMKRKLIEVFSYRNDVSQRRSTVEGALNVMIKNHPVQVPHHALLRKQQEVLNILSLNPDYPVYKMDKDFLYQVEQLALRQLREYTIIDHVTYNEQVKATNYDVKHYLNLTKRPRTKELIYFNSPLTRLDGHEKPIPDEILKQYARREKTLNYIISQLSKQ